MTALKRTGAAAVATLAALAMFAPATPARAETLPATCSTQGFILNAWAYYTPNGPVHEWYQVQFQLDGHRTGGKSNVNFRIWSDLDLVYDYDSPDRIRSYQLYTVTPPQPVRTVAAAPEYAAFVAYFDQFGGDPGCYTTTAVI